MLSGKTAEVLCPIAVARPLSGLTMSTQRPGYSAKAERYRIISSFVQRLSKKEQKCNGESR